MEKDSDSFDSSDPAYDSEKVDEDQDDSEEFESEGSDKESPYKDLDEGTEYSPVEEPEGKKRKKLGFKEWAMKQLNAAKGYIAPLTNPEDPLDAPLTLPRHPSKKRKLEHRAGTREMRGPLGEGLHIPKTAFAQQLQDTAAVISNF